MKKLILILLVLMIPLVSAIPVYQSGSTIDLKIPCTNNGTYCSASAVCNATVINPKGDLIRNGEGMTQNISIFNVSLISEDTEILGTYEFTVCCVDGGDTSCKTLTFKITPNGNDLGIAEGIVYIIFIVALVFIFLLFLYGSIKIPFSNSRSDDGKIISFNDMKYLKVVCMVFSYLILMAIFGIMRQITANYLYLNQAHKTFQWLFWFMLSFVYPIIVVSVILMLVMFFESKKIKKALERGVPIR